MSKQAMEHQTGTLFRMTPGKEHLLIIGYDTKDGPEHALWRADVGAAPKDDLVASVTKHGVITPIRAQKINETQAMVVVGRDRVKAARVAEKNGVDIKIPVLLYPPTATIKEIIGVANAENYARKTESLLAQAEHLHKQMVAEGLNDGVDELTCAKAVAASTGLSVQRIRNIIDFRNDDSLVRAVKGEKIAGETALALATIKDEAKRHKALKDALDDPTATVALMRERVSYMKHEEKAAQREAAASAPAAVDTAPSKLAALPEGKGKDGKKGKTPSKKPTKPAKAAELEFYPGLSKSLARRVVEHQLALEPKERVLDESAIKMLKIVAGLIKPDTLVGFKAVLKDLGFGA